ncbi:unnamed protein product [Paramecium sonneborni]|uniref:NACHT domain-containing protein n=1 Tax=Paramecium sonneborni TaxID=65129 RepID=A0A8S1PB87_9CILI|nr:unnamed protein product [Paramecium sonneborni]
MHTLSLFRNFSLRGGGCAVSKSNAIQSSNQITNHTDVYDFFSQFNQYVNIICSKASIAANQSESDEIMIAIQWFSFQDEKIYFLNKSPQSVQKSYDLILDGIRNLLKSCLIYLKTDTFKCLYILQITASLSKVIFSFHLMNEDRFIKHETQNEFLEIADELKEQFEIEKNDLIQNQLDLFLFLTKTSFEIAPNNANEQEEILKGCLKGIVSSIQSMSPDTDLLESLFQGACHLYKMYNLNQKRKQYEVYYQIDMFQWELINYFKKDKHTNFEEIISQIETIYDTLVKGSNNWIDHYCWIYNIGKILMYNPQLNKKKINQVKESLNLEAVQVNMIWKECHKKGILIHSNHNQNEAIILLNQFKNKKLIQTDRLILEGCFQGWENFIQLKEYLMDDEYSNQFYTLGSYLKFRLNIADENVNNTEEILLLNQIQNVFSFLLPNQLLNLIKKNDEKLRIVIINLKNFMKNTKVRLAQTTNKQQIQKIISNLVEYFQNILYIIKIINLNQNEIYCQIEQTQEQQTQNYNNIQMLKQLLRYLEQILQLLIEEFKEKSNDQKNEQQKQNEDIQLLKEQKEIILTAIEKLFFSDDKKNQFFKNLKEKLISFKETKSYNKNFFLKEALNLLNIIETSTKEIQQQENYTIQNDNLIKCFQDLLKNLFKNYKQLIEKLQIDFKQSTQYLQEFMAVKYQIEDLNAEVILRIQQQFQNEKLINSIYQLRFEMLEQKLKLMTFKESFQNILKLAQLQELQKLQEIINLDQFLVDVIKNYPKRIIRFNLQSQSQEDLKSKLSNQKGMIEYLIFKSKIEEQMNESERLDFQLIENEFGELFIEESYSSLLFHKITNIINCFKFQETLQIIKEQNFNQFQLKIEKEKYENLVKQLRKVQESGNQNNKDFNYFESLKEIIRSIENIIQPLQSFLNQSIDNLLNKKIFKIMIKERLNQFYDIYSQFQKEYEPKNSQNFLEQVHPITLNMQQNQKQDSQEELIENKNDQFKQSENKQENQDQENGQEIKDKKLNNDQIVETNKQNSLNPDKNIKTLQSILKIINLNSIEIKEEQLFLQKLLLEINNFSIQLKFISELKQEAKEKIRQKFIKYFQDSITNFEKDQESRIILAIEKNENLKIYMKSIIVEQKISETNRNEKNNQEKGCFKKQNLTNFLNKLRVDFKEKLSQSCQQTQIYFEQKFLIQQAQKIYLFDKFQEPVDEEQNQQLGFFDSLLQKYKDFQNHDEWKIKQGLVFTIIQISSNCFTDQIIQFCQKALIQIWTKEKDERVRNLLKNQELLSMQSQILQKDWKTQHDRIASEMQQMLRKIDDLQEQIANEANLNKRDQMLQELDDTTLELDEYIENISEMGLQLKLITDFVNHIRKGLMKVERKITQMKEQLNNIGNDIKFLKGKSVDYLLEIRKWKVLKEAAQKNVNSIYVPLKTQEKGQNNQSNLINLEQFDDKEGEVNEFLLEKQKIVLLIHGVAGSGKSTTAKKIEEFIWKLHNKNIRIRDQILIPIYISLPSLKNPVNQAVEETLNQDDYGFDDLQFRECKEMLERKVFRFLLIMDSYDEMKLENIQKNLYISNKLLQNWSNPLVIFTTRSEIFTNSNYADWFATENKEVEFKEIQLLQFDESQQLRYLKKFSYLSIKMLIYEVYERQVKLEKERTVEIQKFEQSWDRLQQQLLFLNEEIKESENLLNIKQIESIVAFLKNDKFYSQLSKEAFRSLSINLQNLWSIQKYQKMMRMINLDKLIETPYMMEIVVQVLPLMSLKAAQFINLRRTFIKNFKKSFSEFFLSKSRIKIYQDQQKQVLKQIDIVKIQELLDKIDYQQLAAQIWNQMELKQIIKDFQITNEMNELKQKIQENCLQFFDDSKGIVKTFKIENEFIIQLICDALKEQKLTSYDFYDEFIRQYHLKQIEKQRYLGKSINVDRFLHDLQKYSIKLAKEMSKKEITQVQFKQQGLLYQEIEQVEEWLDEFFNDDKKNGSYKKDIRSCSLIQQKGLSFQFVHKSIQEFLIAADLYDILVLSKDLQTRILRKILEIMTKRNLSFFLDNQRMENIQDTYIEESNLNNFSPYDRQKEIREIEINIQKLTNLIKLIKSHDFNKITYSTDNYGETRKYLIQKISSINEVIEFLKFLVQLTSIDRRFIYSGSNSLNLLVEMKVDLTQQCFQNIRIENTSLIGASFAKSDLSGSQFTNVKINSINLNGSLLLNCNWENLQINELNKIEGHTNCVYSVCFSPDGNTLASGSEDYSVRLWDVKTGQQKAKLNGHSESVRSVCFSPDGTILGSSSTDSSIRLWYAQDGKQKAKLDGHNGTVWSICFSPDGTTLASGSTDYSIRLWDVKTENQKAIFEGHNSTVYSVCFSPDGSTLASGGGENIILFYLNYQPEQQLESSHNGKVNSVSFSPDGNILASGSEDNTIILWDVKSLIIIKKLEGQNCPVQSICFSPDGTTLASGSLDDSIRLWNVKSGKEKKRLEGHNNSVYSVCYSPDDTILASCSRDFSIRLWDIKSEQDKNRQEGHLNWVWSVCFSPDGFTLASGSRDNSIRLWDVKSGKEKKQLEGHYGSIWSVCFSSDGTLLASCGGDNTIRLWDVKSGQQMNKLQGHQKWVWTICFQVDNHSIASGSEDNTIIIWDASSGQELKKLVGHTDWVMSVSFSPDGSILASGSRDNSIRLWDAKSNSWEVLKVLQSHKGSIYSVCFSPDSSQIASGSEDKIIILWGVSSGQELKKLVGHTNWVMSVSFSPDGSILASGSRDNSIRLWYVKSGKEIKKLEGHNNSVQSVCFSSDGITLASGSGDNSIRIWDVSSSQEKEIMELHPNSFWQLSFSPDDTTLASNSGNYSICIWNLKTGEQMNQLKGHTNQILQVCFSHDTSILASASLDNTLLIWNLQSQQIIKKLDSSINLYCTLCFSPNVTLLASASQDNCIHLWDISQDYKIIQSFQHQNQILSISFSPDGSKLASGCRDYIIRLWNLNSGKLDRELESQNGPAYSVCFSKDSMKLQASCWDNSFLKWNVNSGKQIDEEFQTEFSNQLNENSQEMLTKVRISQKDKFEANGTKILKGKFINHLGMDLRKLFQQKGSIILEDKKKQEDELKNQKN